MNYSFVNRPTVKNDIIKAIDYHKEISPELAKRFLFRIREAKTYILRSPLSFEVKYSQVRTLMLKQFPYHIHYLVNEFEKRIVILAIIHAYKNPTDYSVR